MTTAKPNHPWDDIIRDAEILIAEGSDLYQKYTCSGCHTRLIIEEPNKFYTKGACDRCDVITDIKKDGCNYLLIAPGKAARAITIAEVE